MLGQQIVRYLAGQREPQSLHTWGYLTTKSRGKREISRIDVNLIPETGDTTWGPFLPREGPVANKRRTIVELQEYSNPIPTTSDFNLTTGNVSKR